MDLFQVRYFGIITIEWREPGILTRNQQLQVGQYYWQ